MHNLTAIISFVVLGQFLFAQESLFKHYTVKDGLPSNHIYAVQEDQNGYIWACTPRGISKFDGDGFVNFTVEDGLPTNDVWNIYEDSKNRMWPHFRGHDLCYIENDSVHLIPLGFDFEGSVIYEYKDTIKVYNNFTNQVYSVVEDSIVSTIKVRSLISLLNIYLGYVGSDYALVQSGDYYRALKLNDQVLEELVINSNASIQESIYRDSICAFRFQISNDNVHIFEGKDSYHKINLSEKLGEKVERVRMELYHEKLHIQTEYGLILYDLKTKSEQIISVQQWVLKHTATRTILDSKENYWVCTLNGLFLLSKDYAQLKAYKIDGIPFKAIENIVYKDEFYVFNELSGFVRCNLDDEFECRTINIKTSDYIHFVDELEDKLIIDGNKILSGDFIENYNFIDQSSSKYFQLQNRIDSFVYSRIFSKPHFPIKVYPFSEGNMYYLYHPRMVIHNKVKNTFKVVPGRFRSYLKSMSYKNCLMLSDDNDLYSLDPLADEPEVKFLQEFDTKVTLLASNKKFDVLTTENNYIYKLIDFNPVKRIHIDGGGIVDVFVDSNDVYVLTENSIQLIDSTFEVSETVFHLGELAFEEFKSIKYYDGQVLLCSNNQILRIPEASFSHKQRKAELKLSEVLADDFIIDGEHKIVLPYNYNQMQLDLDFLNFSDYGNHHYYYQINNGGWKLNNSQDKFSFTNYKPGSYRLDFKAQGANNIVSDVLTCQVQVLKPYWRKWWFYVLSFWLGALGIWMIIKWNVKRARHKQESDNQVKLKFAELESQALRSQMNPHFMFNAMGSIQSLIQSDRKEEADLYLAEFAYLLRMFLDSSRTKFITLQEELEIVKAYVKIEQLRFGRIDFTIENPRQLDLTEFMIPSLLFQPFIENVFKHAYHSEERDRKLWINISLTSGSRMKIQIHDNGDGLISTLRSNDKMHRSLGSEIIKDRLVTLSSSMNKRFSVRIEDKLSDTDRGVMVEFDLPILESYISI